MQAIDRLALAFAMAAIACAAPGLLNADERNLGLPDVTVTAPPIIPSWKKWMAIYARNFQT
jgi:hypothetical protein